MAYCAETDIEREIQMDINDNTELTSTELTAIIAETDAEIDSKLADKYVVPITGSAALVLIKRIATLLNAGKVQELYGLNKHKNIDPDTKESVSAKLIEGKRMLNDLVKGTTTIAFAINGATLSVANQKAASAYDDGIKASNYTDFGTNFNKDKY